MSEVLTPVQAMRLAISEAEKGAGFVSPNPLVGCVILDKYGHLIGQGYHARLGGPHAEIAALESVKDVSQLSAAQLYVTLEPCSHYGRTPPCAERLATVPLKKVVYGLLDPNPKVAGQGVECLRRAGISVESFNGLQDDLEDLAEIFLYNQNTKRAFTAIKVATTLDGQMAEGSGASPWISGKLALEHVHFLRGSYDAIAVGLGTFQTDNPKLNIRHSRFPDKNNWVFVIDPLGQGLSQLLTSELFKNHPPEMIIWVTKASQPTPQSVQNWVIKHTDAIGFDWAELTRRAYEAGIYSILVEGGATFIGSLLTTSAAQRWYQFLTPDIMGAQHNLNVGAHFEQDRLKLLCPRWQSFGRDFLCSGRLPQRQS